MNDNKQTVLENLVVIIKLNNQYISTYIEFNLSSIFHILFMYMCVVDVGFYKNNKCCAIIIFILNMLLTIIMLLSIFM